MTWSSSEEHGQRRDDILDTLAQLPITEQDQQRPWGPVSSRERWGEKGAFSQKGLFSLPLRLRIRTLGVQTSVGAAGRTKSPCWGQDYGEVGNMPRVGNIRGGPFLWTTLTLACTEVGHLFSFCVLSPCLSDIVPVALLSV